MRPPATAESFRLSVVLPVHNEETILERNVRAFEQHLAALPAIDAFEILLVCNGCRDRSEEISDRLADRSPQSIRALRVADRGLGRAIRAGISAASYEFVMFYAVDLPFGMSVVDASVAAARGNRTRVVIGSKGHPASLVQRDLSRRWFSGAISRVNRLVFGIDVADTQGSLLFPKNLFHRYAGAMDSAGPFFQAQIVIYGQQMGYELFEIPVRLDRSNDERKTRFRLAGDGATYVAAVVREKYKLMTQMAGNGRQT